MGGIKGARRKRTMTISTHERTNNGRALLHPTAAATRQRPGRVSKMHGRRSQNGQTRGSAWRALTRATSRASAARQRPLPANAHGRTADKRRGAAPGGARQPTGCPSRQSGARMPGTQTGAPRRERCARVFCSDRGRGGELSKWREHQSGAPRETHGSDRSRVAVSIVPTTPATAARRPRAGPPRGAGPAGTALRARRTRQKSPHSDAHAPREAVAADPFGCGGRRRRAAPHRPSNRHGCGGGGGGRVPHGEPPTAAGHASQAWWRERKSSRTGRLRHRAHTVGLPPRMTRRSYGRGRCRSERAGGC